MINFGQMAIWYSRQFWSKYWNQKSQNEGFFYEKFLNILQKISKSSKKKERNNQIWIEKDAKNEIPGFSSNLRAEKVKSKNLRQIGPV